jgi:hypothetical protein
MFLWVCDIHVADPGAMLFPGFLLEKTIEVRQACAPSDFAFARRVR